MDRLGPWDTARRVAVAVSGGPDSLALAVLTKAWGDPVALIVDHGLRAESAAESETAQLSLETAGIPARVLRLGLRPGPGVAARARDARYAALTAACRDAGLVDLLLGHHAGDQAETVLMRERRSSGPAGLAGMAALTEGDDVRLLRPLLRFPPERLAAVVRGAGLTPADDPSNHDRRWTRVGLRAEIGADRAALLARAQAAGARRAASEAAVAAALAGAVSLFAEGYAIVAADAALTPGAAAALLRTISGRRYPVRPEALRDGTRAGALVRSKPGGTRLVCREPDAAAPPCLAHPGAVWDGRFRAAACPAGSELGALGGDAGRFRRRPGLPLDVLRTLPALRAGGTLLSIPHLGYADDQLSVLEMHPACVPAAGAPFHAC